MCQSYRHLSLFFPAIFEGLASLKSYYQKSLNTFFFLFAEYFYVLDSVQLFTCKAVDISYYLHETEENIGSQRGWVTCSRSHN